MRPSPEDVRAAHRRRQEDPDPAGSWWTFILVTSVGLLLAAILGGCLLPVQPSGSSSAPESLDILLTAAAPYIVGTSSGWYVRFRPAFRFHDLRRDSYWERVVEEEAPGGKITLGRLNPGGRLFVYRLFLPHGAVHGDAHEARALAERIRDDVEGSP